MARLEIEDSGPRDAPAVLLIAGLGEQLTRWPEGLIAELRRRGLRVVRFDNRDAGLSERFPTPQTEDLRAFARAVADGGKVALPYSLDDMAEDALDVLDLLNIPSAHLLGVSLGAMIAQLAAARRPMAVSSLTLVMTSSGEPQHTRPTPQLWMALLGGGTGNAEEQAAKRRLAWAKSLAGPGFPVDEKAVEEDARRDFGRAHTLGGTLRQIGAALIQGDRRADLGRIRAATEIVHGASDPLLDVAGAEAVADAIPGARLTVIDGMGHDLPLSLMDQLLAAFDRALERSAGEVPREKSTNADPGASLPGALAG
jgi:pimeloyl-ACP methyl ester carboxylesterase